MLSILYDYVPTPKATGVQASIQGRLHINTKWSAYVLDTLGGITMLAVGVFGSMGMIAALTPAASWALIGAGGVYAGVSAMMWMQYYIQKNCQASRL